VVDLHGVRNVVVSWSLRSPGALDGVSVLEASGLEVVLVNSDSAGEAAAFLPYVCARGRIGKMNPASRHPRA